MAQKRDIDMTHQNEQCAICGEGHLHNTVETNSVTYKDTTKDLSLYGSTCDVCGSEQANAVDVRNNKRAMLAFKKEVDGLLSGAEIAAIRKQYGISQKQAAAIFGGGPVAFSKYEADDVIQSEPMDNSLRLCRAQLSSFIWLADKVGLADVVEKLTEKPRLISNIKSRFKGFEQVKKGTGNALHEEFFLNINNEKTSSKVIHISDFKKVAY
jgi:HTH-type transcriptional regulator / antitoxin MqsA